MATVLIMMQLLNDNTPNVPTSPIVFEVLEISGDVNPGVNYPVTTAGLMIGATDLDGDVLRYTIIQNNCSMSYSFENIFIDAASGELMVTALDRELTPLCTLNVSISDGTTTKYVIVHIDIIDINDNTPQFGMVELAIVEDIRSSDPFYRVPAFDLDEGTNGEIFYLLVNSNNNR